MDAFNEDSIQLHGKRLFLHKTCSSHLIKLTQITYSNYHPCNFLRQEYVICKSWLRLFAYKINLFFKNWKLSLFSMIKYSFFRFFRRYLYFQLRYSSFFVLAEMVTSYFGTRKKARPYSSLINSHQLSN